MEPTTGKFAELDRKIDESLSIIFTFNHPDNPFIVTAEEGGYPVRNEGEGIIPLQANWVWLRSQRIWSTFLREEQAYDYIYGTVLRRSVYEGFAYTTQARVPKSFYQPVDPTVESEHQL